MYIWHRTSDDTHGRRATKKVTVNGSIMLHQRYIYRGYLQIACIDLTRAAHPALWYITWESPRGLGGGLDKLQSMFAPQGRAGNVVPASHPTQPIATRPLAIQKDGSWFTYGWDLTKNICEVYGPAGYIRTAYTYSPYGEVTAAGDVTQPIQWSSEYNDDELGLIYYNYRHYNPVDGRWMGRDLLESLNLYKYVGNNIVELDSLGLAYSGKWEKHRFNQYSPYESYKTKEVPIQSVSWPNGDTFSIDGWWKGLFNQRI